MAYSEKVIDHYENPRNVGVLDKESIGRIMREMNSSYTEEEIEAIVRALDLTNSGDVNFDEFKKVFVRNRRTASAM